MSFKSMFALYAACTVVFVLVALYVFPVLGANPNPPAREKVLSVINLDRFFGDNSKIDNRLNKAKGPLNSR